MGRSAVVRWGGAAFVGAVLLTGCAADAEPAASPEPAPTESMAESPAPQPGAGQPSQSASAPAAAGSYIDYAAYQQDPAGYAAGGDVVLFFNATWCPTCKTTVENLNAAAVPSGLTVVSVDFDSSTELRQQYGVTVQHTFVQVDASGGQLAKWTGSTTADQIASKTV